MYALQAHLSNDPPPCPALHATDSLVHACVGGCSAGAGESTEGIACCVCCSSVVRRTDTFCLHHCVAHRPYMQPCSSAKGCPVVSNAYSGLNPVQSGGGTEWVVFWVVIAGDDVKAVGSPYLVDGPQLAS